MLGKKEKLEAKKNFTKALSHPKMGVVLAVSELRNKTAAEELVLQTKCMFLREKEERKVQPRILATQFAFQEPWVLKETSNGVLSPLLCLIVFTASWWSVTPRS